IGGGIITPAVAVADTAQESDAELAVSAGDVALGDGAAGVYAKEGPVERMANVTDAKLDRTGKYISEDTDRYLNWAVEVLKRADNFYHEGDMPLYEKNSRKVDKPLMTLIERKGGADSLTLRDAIAETSDGAAPHEIKQG